MRFDLKFLTPLVLFASTSPADVTLGRQLITTSNSLNALSVIASPAGDNSRLFCANLNGNIQLVRLDQPNPTPTTFLAVPGVNRFGEGGLLGLAFHPQYASNGVFYMYYTAASQQILIVSGRRSTANPDIADATVQTIMEIGSSVGIHIGGWIGFGPDGSLYVSIGDNGSSSNAQDITQNLRGKILRIDVDGADNIPGNADDDQFPDDTTRNFSIPPTNPFVTTDGDDEIWAYGLRNPFRCSFDRLTGDLWIGDVGAGSQEEISIAPPAVAGINFGWPCREGFATGSSCTPTNYVPPFTAYTHGGAPTPNTPMLPITGNYIIGGVVYRGSAISCLRGQYLFGNSGSQLHSVWKDDAGMPRFYRNRNNLTTGTSGFYTVGEDNAGELYICGSNGQLFRIIAAGTTGLDCNSNSSPDDCDIMQGVSQDANRNDIPDNCECDSIDFNNDTSLFDPQDIAAFLSRYSEGPCIPQSATCNDIDFNNDTSIFDPCDISSFLLVYSEGPCTPCGV